jgi:histidine triad (HIT) family protein
MNQNCLFCKIAKGKVEGYRIFEDKDSLAFLDHRPLFLGHCLLIPKIHYHTLADLPVELIAPLFANVKLLAQAMEEGLGAEGSFIAINNRISQSVPHLHIHIVPRRKGDGLKGFFWPRHSYKDESEILEIQELLKSAINKLISQQGA